MTTSGYVLVVALALAVAGIGLLLGWVQELRWKLRQRRRLIELVVSSLKDGRGPLCDACRAEFISRLDKPA